ncbi:MAG: glycerol-3-phosphate acyltransferase, partial [Lachnospiraceae bacterium]|nr:glycerol-3-phosphate acyltransferase [Lachnospiraceae bacterium]
FLFGKSDPQLDLVLQLYAGLGATLGHNFPFYMNFKGGKGIAVLAGIYLAFGIINVWIPFITGFILFFSIFFATHYVSLASLSVSALFPVMMVVMTLTGFISPGQGAVRIEFFVLALLIMVMAFIRHSENIKRLLSGNERKTYLSKKNKTE